MPKLKTHKGTRKRVKLSATGKVMHKRANAAHMLTKKSSRRVRRLKGNHALQNTAEAKRLKAGLHG